jgi:hypothetical protein
MAEIDESKRNKIILAVVGVVILAAGAGLYWYDQSRNAEVAAARPEKPLPTYPIRPAETPDAIEHPVPAAPAAEGTAALPALADSDASARENLGKLFGKDAVERFFTPEQLVRRLVATVDNLTRPKLSIDQRALKPVQGSFAVTGEGETLALAGDNVARYALYRDLLDHVDAKQLAAAYFRFYPLFQQAYEDLGYPGQYFNDRVVKVIDHLLETPKVEGPILLTQPNVFYEFADPALEERSSGQKLLLRIGGDNADAVKKKLRELRRQLVDGRDPHA